MEKEFIELFKGYEGDFGMADMANTSLESENNKIYIAHLSIDLLIAVLETFWVIFVFIVSGWTISFIETLKNRGLRNIHQTHNKINSFLYQLVLHQKHNIVILVQFW